MKITIQQVIDHTAEVSLEMLLSYLAKQGWKKEYDGDLVWAYRRRNGEYTINVCHREVRAVDLTTAISVLAKIEDRQPHLVLADIAALSEPKPS